MKIEIGDNNKISKSNIGSNVELEGIKNKSKFNFWTMVFIPLTITVVGGLIIFWLTK